MSLVGAGRTVGGDDSDDGDDGDDMNKSDSDDEPFGGYESDEWLSPLSASLSRA